MLELYKAEWILIGCLCFYLLSAKKKNHSAKTLSLDRPKSILWYWYVNTESDQSSLTLNPQYLIFISVPKHFSCFQFPQYFFFQQAKCHIPVAEAAFVPSSVTSILASWKASDTKSPSPSVEISNRRLNLHRVNHLFKLMVCAIISQHLWLV